MHRAENLISVYTTRMADKIDYNILVDVETTYVEAESDPDQQRYVFAYTVTIQNHGNIPAKLLTRHWIITDSNGKTQEVRGEGVVGEQPRYHDSPVPSTVPS